MDFDKPKVYGHTSISDGLVKNAGNTIKAVSNTIIIIITMTS